MKNILCQYLWNRDFDSSRDRWISYRATFAYLHRTCYFLLGHGQSTSNEVPTLWYKWTGESLIVIEQPIPHQIRAELKRRPFYQLEPRHVTKTGASLDAASKRQIIRTRLRSNMKTPKGEIEFLKTPDQAKLLKEEVDPMFWKQIDDLLADKT
ncbi:hypothetical protein F5B19DRAFT_496906 [Rostrohypoxylon terebratum]|nr:hypothetical protein F5B19DRAFT_496906 [Rostrohypoxylon terebratum]